MIWLNANDRNELAKNLKILIPLIREYGINSIIKKLDTKDSIILNEYIINNMNEFITTVHEGYCLAQNLLFKQLWKVYFKSNSLLKAIKNFHILKNSEEKRNFEIKYKSLMNKESIYRKCIDFIAWTIFGLQYYIARRFYLRNSMPDLSDARKNIKFINKHNKENPLQFSLLSDLSSFIQIGDAIQLKFENGSSQLGIIEIKDGQVNQEVFNTIDFYAKTKCDFFLHNVLKQKDKHFSDHLIRNIKQIDKMKKTMNVIMNEKGIDALGCDIKINHEVFITTNYYEQVNRMLDDLKTKNYSLNIIDNCLFLGAYKEDYKYAEKAFYIWASTLLKTKFPLFNFRQSFLIPLSIPPYTLPLSQDDLINLSIGNTKLLLYIDFDKWLKLGETINMPGRWTTREESLELKKDVTTKFMFSHKDKYLIFSYNGKDNIIGEGAICRILFGFETPLSILKAFQFCQDNP